MNSSCELDFTLLSGPVNIYLKGRFVLFLFNVAQEDVEQIEAVILGKPKLIHCSHILWRIFSEIK